MDDGEARRMAPTLPDGVDGSRGRPGYPMDLVFRATVIFLFVFLITRVIGRRELE